MAHDTESTDKIFALIDFFFFPEEEIIIEINRRLCPEVKVRLLISLKFNTFMSLFFFALGLTCFSCVLDLGMRAGAAVRLSPCRRITLCFTLALKLQTSMCLSPGSQIMREGQSSKICSLRWQTVSCNRTIQVYKIAR